MKRYCFTKSPLNAHQGTIQIETSPDCWFEVLIWIPESGINATVVSFITEEGKYTLVRDLKNGLPLEDVDIEPMRVALGSFLDVRTLRLNYAGLCNSHLDVSDNRIKLAYQLGSTLVFDLMPEYLGVYGVNIGMFLTGFNIPATEIDLVHCTPVPGTDGKVVRYYYTTDCIDVGEVIESRGTLEVSIGEAMIVRFSDEPDVLYQLEDLPVTGYAIFVDKDGLPFKGAEEDLMQLNKLLNTHFAPEIYTHIDGHAIFKRGN